jgi:predicted dehydrogenase
MAPTITDKLNIAVIGLGKMGIMHACLLNVLPNVTVSALCDKSRLMRKIAERTFRDSTVTDDLEKLADLNLDAVFVLTPIPSHYSIIKEIYEKKIANNVFVEKTLSSKLAQSQELVKLADHNKSVNMVGYMKRFAVTFNHAKNLLDQHVLGELISFDAYAFSSDFADVPEGSVVSKARGGALEDLGSHVADLATWFFGDLTVSTAKIDSKVAPDSVDSAYFKVETSNALAGTFEVSWCKNGYRMPEFGLSITGNKGSLTVNDDEVALKLNQEEPKKWYRQSLGDNVGFMLGGSEYFREDETFVKAIVNKAHIDSDFENGKRVDRLLEDVRSKAYA